MFLIFCLLLSSLSMADEIDELDAMLDEQEASEEISLDMAMDIDSDLGAGKAEPKFKMHRNNQDSQFKFKGIKKNLVRWESLKADSWLNLEQWKKSRVRKDQEPEWKLNLTERNLRERVGRFLECIGDCRVYRGEGFSTSQFNSAVRELDEIITLSNSYAWVAMMDGTLVRISPNTSLSFKEINVGKKQNFIHIRLNSGNILVLNRENMPIKENNLRETDKIFLPLSLNSANPEESNIKLNEDDLSNFIADDVTVFNHYKKLNTIISENNDFIKEKPTYSMIIMPNGTIYGKNLQAEFIVLLGGESYVKQRSYKEQHFKLAEDSPSESELNFFYRGFENRESYTLDAGTWYKVSPKGKAITPHSNPLEFRVGEYLTSNIPSIYLAREILLKKHSGFLFEDNLDRKKLAENAGYRLWGDLNKDGDDLNMRIKFLKEYTRRVETTNLVVARQFRRKARDRGELTQSMVYDRSFYQRALRDYIVSRESEIVIDTDREVLNSTRKPYWKIINGKTNR